MVVVFSVKFQTAPARFSGGEGREPPSLQSSELTGMITAPLCDSLSSMAAADTNAQELDLMPIGDDVMITEYIG